LVGASHSPLWVAVRYDLALVPAIFRWLAAIPALEIGETHYDPDFPRGAIDGASLCLAAAVLPQLEESNQTRVRRTLELAERLSAETDFAPLLAPPGCEAVYPRLALLAPSPTARDEALQRLAALGATRMYPSPLDEIEALTPHLTAVPEIPRARDFAARLLTLPTGKGLTGERLEFTLRALR